jgi:transposase-like protein
MTKSRMKVYRYSICFKEKVVQEVSSGESVSSVMRKYGLKGYGTVKRWIVQYGREDLLNELIYVKMKNETDEIKELQKEITQLKVALADATLARTALESLVKVANEHYSTDLKKNFGSALSSRVTPKKE